MSESQLIVPLAQARCSGREEISSVQEFSSVQEISSAQEITSVQEISPVQEWLIFLTYPSSELSSQRSFIQKELAQLSSSFTSQWNTVLYTSLGHAGFQISSAKDAISCPTLIEAFNHC